MSDAISFFLVYIIADISKTMALRVFPDMSAVTALLISYCLIISFYFLIFIFRKENFLSYIGFKSFNVLDFLLAAVLGIIANFLTKIAMTVIKLPDGWLSKFSDSNEALSQNADKALLIVCIVLLAPVIEEIVFRGALLTSLTRAAGPVLAAIITSGLFAAAHRGGVIQIFYAFIIGVMLAAIRRRTGSIYAALAFHLTYNGINFISLPSGDISIGTVAALILMLLGGFTVLIRRGKGYEHT